MSSRLLVPARQAQLQLQSQFHPRAVSLTNRAVLRSRTRLTNRRFQSTAPPPASASPPPSQSGGSSGAVVGGIAGGVLVTLLGYSWYHFSGAKQLVNTAHSTKSYIDSAFKSSSGGQPPAPGQAIQWLRDTVSGYTKFIPGAQGYVDTAFKDLQTVQEKHGDELDSIVRDTYAELKDVTKAGASVEAASKAWDVLQKCLKRMTSLAGDASNDVLSNHPELKDKVGGEVQRLKQMAGQYGPEAKKQVDETWNQVQDVLKGGLTQDNINKIQNLVREKSKELQKYGDDAWKKGMEQAKPLLDKQPQLKEMVEKNKDKLLQGDLGALWKKLQEAVKTGNTDDVQKFVQEQLQQGEKKGGAGLEQFFGMIPGGGDVMSKLRQLQELSQKHGHEAENLIKSALQDVKSVLDKKVEEGKDLKEKAEKDAKS